MKKILLLVLGTLLSAPAFANPTCKYQDVDGHIIYANVPIKGAVKLMCFGSEAASAPSSNAASSRPRAASPTPANFPRVDAATQKQRDNKRRQILLDELATERKAVEEAKQAYSEANAEVARVRGNRGGSAKLDEKLQSLRANVALHEKNIQLLEKELSGLK